MADLQDEGREAAPAVQITAPPWGRRYRLMKHGLVLATLQIVAGGAHAYLGMDPEVAKVMILAGSGQWAAIIGCYVFGATWQDIGLGAQLGTRYRPMTPRLRAAPATTGRVDEPE